jgi:hypothetical protein
MINLTRITGIMPMSGRPAGSSKVQVEAAIG